MISDNTGDGVDFVASIFGGPSGNTIGGTTSDAGNTITDNGGDGVRFYGAGISDNLVAGNTISSNGSAGVALSATSAGGPSSNVVGGPTAAYGNAISGNGGAGIYVYGSGTINNLFGANTISDNTGDGVDIIASSSGGPSGNVFGGSSAAYGNTITGNGGAGIYVFGSGTVNNLFAANTISDNTGDGVDFVASILGGPSGNTIGGTSAGAGNTISDNVGDGVKFYGAGISATSLTVTRSPPMEAQASPSPRAAPAAPAATPSAGRPPLTAIPSAATAAPASMSTAAGR